MVKGEGMKSREWQRLEERAEFLKAIANPVRLYVLEALAEGKKSVGEMVAAAGLGESALSHHLGRMRRSRILDRRRSGKSIYYGLRWNTILAVREIAEFVLAKTTRELKALFRTENKVVNPERRHAKIRGGRNILKGRIF